jgi:hypothetical protein
MESISLSFGNSQKFHKVNAAHRQFRSETSIKVLRQSRHSRRSSTSTSSESSRSSSSRSSRSSQSSGPLGRAGLSTDSRPGAPRRGRVRSSAAVDARHGVGPTARAALLAVRVDGDAPPLGRGRRASGPRAALPVDHRPPSTEHMC